MIKTYQEIISILQVVAISGGSSIVKGFGNGYVYDVNTGENDYPLIWVDPYMKPHRYKNGVLYLNADIYVIDLVKDDRSNEIFVISDTMRIALDFINELKDNYSAYGFWINKTQGSEIRFEQFSEKWDDQVSGIKFNVDFEIPDDGSTCEQIFSTVVSSEGTVW